MNSGLAQFIASQPVIQEQVAQQDQEYSLIGGGWSMMPDTTDQASEFMDANKTKEDQVALLKKRERLPGVKPLPSDSDNADGMVIIEMEEEEEANKEEEEEEFPSRRRTRHSSLTTKISKKDTATDKKNRIEHRLTQLTFDDLRLYFCKPKDEVMEELGIPNHNVFTKLLNRLRISHWPFRNIMSLNTAMKRIETSLLVTKPSINVIEKANKFIQNIMISIEDEIMSTRIPENESMPIISKNSKKKGKKNDTGNDDDDLRMELSETEDDEMGKNSTNSVNNMTRKAVQLSAYILAQASVPEKDARRIVRTFIGDKSDAYLGPKTPINTWKKRSTMKLVNNTNNNQNKIKNILKKGWFEENRDDGRRGGRLPVRDELLDTLGTSVALRTLDTIDDSDNEFEDQLNQFQAGSNTTDAKSDMHQTTKNSSGSSTSSKKRSRLLCHDGVVDLPPLVYNDTSDINREGLTIILVEPQVFAPPLSSRSMQIIPKFAI
jgi:hypothetical protein